MPEPRIILEPECCYHIYNHAVGNENLFSSDADYLYFLSKMKEYIAPVCDIFSYCLMPNHFHLILRIKEEADIQKVLNQKLSINKKSNRESVANGNYLSDQLSKVFSNFFNTYAKHYNFRMNRKGTLFKRAFRRKRIADLGYLRKVICYVHQNPVEAGFADSLTEWKFSSFNTILGQQPTLLLREEVISLFDDIVNFKYCHSKNVELPVE